MHTDYATPHELTQLLTEAVARHDAIADCPLTVDERDAALADLPAFGRALHCQYSLAHDPATFSLDDVGGDEYPTDACADVDAWWRQHEARYRVHRIACVALGLDCPYGESAEQATYAAEVAARRATLRPLIADIERPAADVAYLHDVTGRRAAASRDWDAAELAAIDDGIARVEARAAERGCSKLEAHDMLEGERRQALESAAADVIARAKLTAKVTEGALQLEDFEAYLPEHKYIHRTTGGHWPAASVDSALPWPNAGGKPMKPSLFLDKNRPIRQMTWLPGALDIIEGKAFIDAGVIDDPGSRVLNLYRPPRIERGDPTQAGPWLDHVHTLYPEDAEHIVLWLAHRVQRPGEKINHGLVLGGDPGIGKDTLLEPVIRAVGHGNTSEIKPEQLMGRFNPFAKSVILRISEAHDLGDLTRAAFADACKVYLAAPPAALRVDEKNIREYHVPNVCGVVFTTNHRTDGLYLEENDRRHFVCWSEVTKDSFAEGYWIHMYQWFDTGGAANVAAYLRGLDLSSFDPKAAPRKTRAFWTMVEAARSPETNDMRTALAALGNPDVVTAGDLVRIAFGAGGLEAFAAGLQDPRNRRRLPHEMGRHNYVKVTNPAAADGLWRIDGARQAVYGRASLTFSEHCRALRSRGVTA